MTERERIERLWDICSRQIGQAALDGDCECLRTLWMHRDLTLTDRERADLAALEAKYMPPGKGTGR